MMANQPQWRFRTVAPGYSCHCGVPDMDRCIAGLDCAAVRTTREIRQAGSRAAETDRPRREAERQATDREDHRQVWNHLYDRFAALGIDPYELRDFLKDLPPRG